MKVQNVNNGIYYYHYYPSFQAYEKTFAMFKPDAFNRGLVPTIMRELEATGLEISENAEMTPKMEDMRKLYNRHLNKPFFDEWMNYLTNGRIRVMIIEGEDAVQRVLDVKKRIRGAFVNDGERRYNLMHSSDTVDDAKREGGIFFDTIG